MRDIAIIGGGLVGLCAALVFQHRQRSVTVIEAGNIEQQPTEGLGARTIALSASSVQVFRALGIWSRLEARATPIRHIHVSSRGRWGVARLRARDYELDSLGYVIENPALNNGLLDAVMESKSIKLQQNASFESISQAETVDIGYRSSGRLRHLQAKLALVADGAHSQARSALAIDHQVIDYGQSIVICNVEVDRPRGETAYERFTPQGPLAMLPLGGRRYACVWTLGPERADEVYGMDDEGFMAALQDCFGYRLGFIEAASPRFSVPLQRVRAETLKAGRCLLIGNAANALHPVAGQSFNLSLRDVACLYELLCEQSLDELDNAAFAELAADYEMQRAREQGKVIRYGDGLVSVFSNDLPVLEHVRAAGLGVLDLVPALKLQAAFSGMGLTFGGNRMLRGRL
jgi:2-octaprenyl-6-methoxyphenol hydroxylase